MAYTPSFSAPKTIKMAFVTNNPTGQDNESQPVQINELRFNETTRSIEAVCSDRRIRQCRIDRFPSDAPVKALEKALKKALDSRQLVTFIAAGANNPDTWFYNIKVSNN